MLTRQDDLIQSDNLITIVTMDLQQQHHQLLDAVRNNRINDVRNWLTIIGPVPDFILLASLRNEDLECLKLLAPQCSVAAIGRGMSRSVTQNVMSALHLLLPYSDPHGIEQALVYACIGNKKDMIDLLHPLCDAQKVLTLVENDWGSAQQGKQYLQDVLNQHQAERIQQEVHGLGGLAPSRKM